MNENQIIETIKTSDSLLVYFSYPECSVCRTLRPKVENLLENYPAIQFQYVDINRMPIFKGQYLIFTVPTILIFQNGKEQKRYGRHFSLLELEDFLKRIAL